MSDPRIQTVVNVLVEQGHNATGSGMDTDTLATAIVNALDAQHGAGEAETGGGEGDAAGTAAEGGQGNPETPTGTGTEGGAGTPAS